MSRRSTSFSIAVAASSEAMKAICPFSLARRMSSSVSPRTMKS
jgi:hypothetical protein